jgi:hypothetical protein
VSSTPLKAIVIGAKAKSPVKTESGAECQEWRLSADPKATRIDRTRRTRRSARLDKQISCIGSLAVEGSLPKPAEVSDESLSPIKADYLQTKPELPLRLSTRTGKSKQTRRRRRRHSMIVVRIVAYGGMNERCRKPHRLSWKPVDRVVRSQKQS